MVKDTRKAAPRTQPAAGNGEAIHWTEAMSVGVPELDDDHKELMRIINQLAENAGDRAGEENLRQCIRALMRYAEVHFGREERVMAVCAFPALAHHQEEHRAFVNEMQALSGRFENDPEGLSTYITDELTAYLITWLRHHIMIEDKAYRSFAEHKLAEAREAARSFRHSQVWFSGN